MLLKFLNLTGHQIHLLNTETGYVSTVEPCGTIANGKFVEEDAGVHPGTAAKLVRMRIVPDPKSVEEVERLRAQYPSHLFLGSLIAAQAFPGVIAGIISAPGFERVPAHEKRVLCNKFTIY